MKICVMYIVYEYMCYVYYLGIYVLLCILSMNICVMYIVHEYMCYVYCL